MKIISESLEPLIIDINSHNNLMTISELKSTICCQANIEENINLVYCGKKLLNNKNISDYQIDNHSCIQVFKEINLPLPDEETEQSQSRNREPNRRHSSRASSDNINIMYEFSLGENLPFSLSSSSTNLNGTNQLSNIFNLLNNMSVSSRNNREPRSSSTSSSYRQNNNTQNNTDNSNINNIRNNSNSGLSDNQNNTDNSNINNIRNNSNSGLSDNQNSEQINSSQESLREDNHLQTNDFYNLWRIINNLESQSDLTPILEILSRHGLDISVNQLQQFLNNINNNNGHRLTILSSLISILNYVSTRNNNHQISTLSTENSNIDYSHCIPQIKEMGFYDEQLILESLNKCHGNINLTIETLLNKINNAS